MCTKCTCHFCFCLPTQRQTQNTNKGSRLFTAQEDKTTLDRNVVLSPLVVQSLEPLFVHGSASLPLPSLGSFRFFLLKMKQECFSMFWEAVRRRINGTFRLTLTLTLTLILMVMRHGLWVMSRRLNHMYCGFARTSLSTLSIPFVPYVIRVLIGLP